MPQHENDTVKEDQEGCKILNEIESCTLFFFFWGKFSNSYVVMICNFAL